MRNSQRCLVSLLIGTVGCTSCRERALQIWLTACIRAAQIRTWEAILKMRALLIMTSPVRERLVSQYDCMLQTGAGGDFFSALEEACHMLSVTSLDSHTLDSKQGTGSAAMYST